MKKRLSESILLELAADVERELVRLRQLEAEIQRIQQEIQQQPSYVDIFYENQALKLHNFYTGCERIFRLISELNGSLPEGTDWHRRLLERMAETREDRPAVLSVETTHRLRNYLGFRHVLRNIYAFELDLPRVKQLVADYPAVWHQFDQEVKEFVQWLRSLAEQFEASTEIK